MAAVRAMLRCVLIWILMSLGIVRTGSVLVRVSLSVILTIVSLGGGDVNRRLAMGQAGLDLVFVGLMRLGLLWLQCLLMLRYGLFSFGVWAQASCSMDLFWAWFGSWGGYRLVSVW